MPFFAPLYNSGSEWDVYGPSPGDRSLREALRVQMSPPFFPVHLDSLPANIRFHDLGEGSFQLGDACVTTQFLNHPGPTLGYRIEADGAVMVYVCDHEPHGFSDSFLSHEFNSEDTRHIAFLEGADLVIHDAQYITKEFKSKRGWGHSVGDYVVEVCRRAGVARVALTHHDPSRTDESIDDLLARLHHTFRGKSGVPEIIAAAEGQQFDVVGLRH
jgi:ribonuclease BN (tRNA processing enzyme)